MPETIIPALKFRIIRPEEIAHLLGWDIQVELPFPDIRDYSKICVRLPENIDYETLNKHLRRIDDRTLLQEINKVRTRFSLLGVQEEIYRRMYWEKQAHEPGSLLALP